MPAYTSPVRLLERDHPIDVLQTRADRAAAGRGGLVLLVGEAGIGKTALLRAFAERVSMPVLWGMCDPLSTPRPLGPLRDVAGVLGAAVTASLRGSAAQHEIFAAVLDALRETPRVLVVEDLHWADEATTDLVRFLARRIDALPLLMVVSCRDTVGADPVLSPVVGDLVSTPGVRRMQLTPLSRAAVAELLEGHLLDPADVHQRTAGNPFFVSQIIDQPDAPLPESVRDAVIARTAGLSPEERHSIELLACAPDGVSSALLGALDMSAGTVGALAATGLLDRSGRGVAFRHEIARSAVLGAVALGSESALHATMIAALERIGADASVLAHHAVAAHDVGRILRYAAEAGAESARAGAHREAVAFYELALPHVADPAGRADLLEALSVELYLTDRLDDAIEARVQAVALRGDLADTAAVGAGHTAISGLAWYDADLVTAVRHKDAAIAILSGTDDARALGFALANHAFLAAQQGDTGEARTAGTRALRIADDSGDPVLHGFATIGVAVARLLDGDVTARADLLAARDAGLRQHHDDLATTPMSNLCHLDVEQGRFDDAEESIASALRISEERDTPICTMWQLGVRARLRLLQDDWPAAERDARAVLAAGKFPLGRLWPRLVLGVLAARRDAPPDNPDLDELWSIADRIDNLGKIAPAAAALAEQAWILRRPDPRLTDPRVGALLERAAPGGVPATLRAWARRLVRAGVQDIGPADDGPVAAPRGPYEQALVHWDEDSADALLAALPVLDGLGARAVGALFRGRLRERGVNSIPRGRSATTRANPAGLTERQLDVLALLVDGLTNAEIAARLVISPRTADHHVSAILDKLEVRTRKEAAARARRLGV
jgi:DNA-binding CsgD family transcriptional regulator/tetratricopeptide (TPR) repeat protein